MCLGVPDLGEEGLEIARSYPDQASAADISPEMASMLVARIPQLVNVGMEDAVKTKIPLVMNQILEDFTNTKLPVMFHKEFRKAFRQVMPDIRKAFHKEFRKAFHKEFRKAVKEEIQSSKEGNLAGNNWTSANVAGLPNDRNLHLKFCEAPDDVLTGKEIKAKGDTPNDSQHLTVTIVDEAGQVIQSGPESSVQVEILLLDASKDNKEHSWSHEDFNKKIIDGSDKKKPHFPQKYYVNLEKGVATLSSAKLGNASGWMKRSMCRLGARVVGNVRGAWVKEGCTEPFVVSDSRTQLNEKHRPPSPSDNVWRLDNIAKDGKPYKRLKKNNVETVEDLLFLRTVHPEKLKSDRARELLLSVLEHKDRISSYNNEETLKQRFPSQASEALPNALIQEIVPARFNPTIKISGQNEAPELLSASASESFLKVSSNEGNPIVEDFTVLDKSKAPLDWSIPNLHGPTFSNLNLARDPTSPCIEAISQTPLYSPNMDFLPVLQDSTTIPPGSTERQSDAPAPNSGENQMTGTWVGGVGGISHHFPF